MSDLTPLQQDAWDRSCYPCRDEAHQLCEGVVWVAAENDSVECGCGHLRPAHDDGDTDSHSGSHDGTGTHTVGENGHVSDLRPVGNDEGAQG